MSLSKYDFDREFILRATCCECDANEEWIVNSYYKLRDYETLIKFQIDKEVELFYHYLYRELGWRYGLSSSELETEFGWLCLSCILDYEYDYGKGMWDNE